MKASLPHYFIGIPIPADIAEPIWEATKKEPVLTFKKWVHPHDYHITLIFLGAADEERLAKLSSPLADACVGGCDRLPYSFSIWIFSATADSRECFTLSPNGMNSSLICGKNKTGCFESRFSSGKRPYHPHMTMARKWAGDRPFPDDVPFESGRVQSAVSRFSLFQTHLDRSPKYEEIAQFQLT